MMLSPKMQQALHLLQVPALELQELVRQELVQNPTLEQVEEDREPDPGGEAEAGEIEPTVYDDENVDSYDRDLLEDYYRILEADREWRDYYRENYNMILDRAPDQEMLDFAQQSRTRPVPLDEYLIGQLGTAGLSPEEREIAETIIGRIDGNGYLGTDLEILAEEARAGIETVERALTAVQHLDPPGIGARSLEECLLLQIYASPFPHPLASRIVSGHLEELGRREYARIARALRVSEKEVRAAAAFIATLNPRPASPFHDETGTYVIPDITLADVDGDYHISLNQEHNPEIRISGAYRRMLENPETDPETRRYLRQKIRRALDLIRNLDMRENTLYRLAAEIMKRQPEFLEKGAEHLKPMTMKELAQALDVHESTVSRAVANKYIHTPRGTFPLRFFFSTALKGAGGEDVSSERVRHRIRRLVGEENPRRPHSDRKLAELLSRDGVEVARRTVTKYREQLGIPSTRERRRA